MAEKQMEEAHSSQWASVLANGELQFLFSCDQDYFWTPSAQQTILGFQMLSPRNLKPVGKSYQRDMWQERNI